MAPMHARHFDHFTSSVSLANSGLSGRLSPLRVFNKCQLAGSSINWGAWDIATQPTRFAISLFVQGSSVQGLRRRDQATVAFMSDNSGTLTLSLNQLEPLSSLPNKSPLRWAAYMLLALAGSKAKLSTKLWFAWDTAPSSFCQLLPASVERIRNAWASPPRLRHWPGWPLATAEQSTLDCCG